MLGGTLHQTCDFIRSKDEGYRPSLPLFAEDSIRWDFVLRILGMRIPSQTNHGFQAPVPLKRRLGLTCPFNHGLCHDVDFSPVFREIAKIAQQWLDVF
jgi:hypothetical protein